MAGCKRCALKGEKGKGKRREKKRKKEEKNGDQNRFLCPQLWKSGEHIAFGLCVRPSFRPFKTEFKLGF